MSARPLPGTLHRHRDTHAWPSTQLSQGEAAGKRHGTGDVEAPGARRRRRARRSGSAGSAGRSASPGIATPRAGMPRSAVASWSSSTVSCPGSPKTGSVAGAIAPPSLFRAPEGEAAWTPPPGQPRRVLGQEVVRVRQLERLVGEAALEVAELVAEVGDDVVAERLDVRPGRRLVVDRSCTSRSGSLAQAALQVVRVVGDGRLGEQAVLAVVQRRRRRVAGVDADAVRGQVAERGGLLRGRPAGQEEDRVALAARPRSPCRPCPGTAGNSWLGDEGGVGRRVERPVAEDLVVPGGQRGVVDVEHDRLDRACCGRVGARCEPALAAAAATDSPPWRSCCRRANTPVPSGSP